MIKRGIIGAAFVWLWIAAAFAVVYNPTSTLTLTSATTQYSAGQLIANNATAASVTVPSFNIPNTPSGAIIPRVRLFSDDTLSTAWAGQTIQIDLWNAAPTFVNGDRGAWQVATGSNGHLATFTCIMSAIQSDGSFASCSIGVGNFAAIINAALATPVYWSAKAVTGTSGVTTASKHLTLTVEILN